MYKDVQNSNNVDKQMLNQLVNGNVNHSYSKQNSKSAVFTALFFYLTKKSAMNFAMNVQ